MLFLIVANNPLKPYFGYLIEIDVKSYWVSMRYKPCQGVKTFAWETDLDPDALCCSIMRVLIVEEINSLSVIWRRFNTVL